MKSNWWRVLVLAVVVVGIVLVAMAASNHLELAELQLDFDCAESKLDGYRVWVEAIRSRLAPTSDRRPRRW